MKPIHKAICAGVGGAVIAFAIASLVCADGPSDRSHDGMVLIVCGPHVADVRPWYWAFGGYVLAFTPMLLFTSPRVRSDTFRHDHAAS
jgi:hypothetical protein